MAKRILSADSVLVSQPQPSLVTSVRTELPAGFLHTLQRKWRDLDVLGPETLLFAWEEGGALAEEIAFVNRAQAFLDEAAVKIAPSVLRIVLTVQRHLPDRRRQRAYLGEKLALDFRRVSELCIVADSYGLLAPERRAAGEREIERYGWSKALKLAHVRDPADRADIWERACNGRGSAGYRAVLEEIRRFRERKLIGPPVAEPRFEALLSSATGRFDALRARAARLDSREALQDALREVRQVQRDLVQVRRALREKLEMVDVHALAARA